MDSQDSSTAESDTIFDKRMEAKAMPLSLLKRITDDFSDSLEIGRGGFAVVYKGLLENGIIAVKKLSEASDIDERKFLREVDCLMKAKHKNIVQFLGYCADTQGHWMEHNGKSVMADVRHRLLCFEYLPNGSLDKYIKDPPREWRKCYQIIKGVCEGLHYLHKERRIVHSDLKPANILLDNDMEPKIADFGISRCFDEKQTHTITKNITGSMGYLSPEVLGGKISFKSDIFSLGVIIIELLTGEKGYPDVKNVLKYWRHKVEKSQEEHQLEQIRVCTEVGQSCLEYDPAKRPSAQDITKILKQTESNEQCIATGASSSTGSQASSHIVQDKNKSSRPFATSHLYDKNKSNGSTTSTVPRASSSSSCSTVRLASLHVPNGSIPSRASSHEVLKGKKKPIRSIVVHSSSHVPGWQSVMMQYGDDDKNRSNGSTTSHASSHEVSKKSNSSTVLHASSYYPPRRPSSSSCPTVRLESLGVPNNKRSDMEPPIIIQMRKT